VTRKLSLNYVFVRRNVIVFQLFASLNGIIMLKIIQRSLIVF
jgi:hypothetical protein